MVGLVFLCTLIGTRSAAAQQQLRGGEAEDEAGVLDTPPHFALRPSASQDDTEEFLDEIYTQRPAVVATLLHDFDEEKLIKSIEDPENAFAATTLCQLGNLYASEGFEEDAAQCFQVSAEGFDMGGMYNYANALLRGRGCEKNEAAATVWFREAAGMICDSSSFLRRHLPNSCYVSEPGVEGRDQMQLEYDESHELLKISDASGVVVWDAAHDSQEELESLFKGLDLETEDLPDAGVMSMAVPTPLKSGYKQAVIDMNGLLKGSEDMSADIDFEKGTVSVKAFDADGDARSLSSEETLGAILLQVSLNRGKTGNATRYTEDLHKSKGWLAALDVMQKGVAEGNKHMCTVLGALYATGLGVERDPEKAHLLFLQAAKKGVPEAMNNVALYLLRKRDDELASANTAENTTGNTNRAKKAVVKAKRFRAHPRFLNPVWHWLPSPLQSVLSILFLSGSVSEEEMWLYKARQAGCATATYNIAVMIEKSSIRQGKTPNVPVSFNLYQEAADLGHGFAMNNLAVLYLEAKPSHPSNIILARKWLRKAAEEPSGVFLPTDAYAKEQFDGSEFDEEDPDRDLSQVPGKNPAMEALYNLGIINELGLGAKPNLVSASRWYSLAMEKGLRDAGHPQYLY